SDYEWDLRVAFVEGCAKGPGWTPKRQFDYQRETWLRGFEYSLMWPLLADPNRVVTQIERPLVEVFMGPMNLMPGHPDLFESRGRQIPRKPPFTERIAGVRQAGSPRGQIVSLQLLYDPNREGPHQGQPFDLARPPMLWEPDSRLTKVRIFSTAEFTLGMELLDEDGRRLGFVGTGDGDGELCEMQGWEVSQILLDPVRTLAMSGAWTSLVGFRPRNSVITGPNLKTTPASYYQLTDVDSGTVLDLDAYTLTQPATALCRAPDGNPTQRWTLEEDTPGQWRLVNAYSGALLSADDNGVIALPALNDTVAGADAEVTAGTSLSAERRGDGTWQLTAAGHSFPLAVRADRTLAPATPGEQAARWSLVPVTDSEEPLPRNGLLARGPAVRMDDGTVTTRMAARPPSAGSEDAPSGDAHAGVSTDGSGAGGWPLSFWLPRDIDADSITVLGDGARLISTEAADRGVHVSVDVTAGVRSAGQIAFDLVVRLPDGVDSLPIMADARLAGLSLPAAAEPRTHNA
ncbi:RICIN domain-containing protein, partial [Streptomyces sp. NPDC052196]|uniref:RICIN domain-containing protein n=1 Tax=Streptomyces sp. NPDC052196 TaxID=3156691 RepID=UPI003431442A